MKKYINSGRIEVEPVTISKNRASLKSHMSRGVLVFYLCFISLFSIYAQEKRPRIAVIDFEYVLDHNTPHPSLAKNRAEKIPSFLIIELVNTKKYIVLERSRVDQIIDELGLQSTQNVSSRAAEIGKLLGTNKIITGVCFYNETHVRLIDIESGSIEAAIIIAHSVPTYNRRGKINGSRSLSDKEMAQKIIEQLKE